MNATRAGLPTGGSVASREPPVWAVGAASAAYAALLGYLTIGDKRLALGAALIGLLVGVVVGNLARLAVVATAGVWLITRAPGNISVTDVLVALAGAAALAAGAAQTIHPRGRVVLRSFVFYLGTLSVTLAFNQSFRSDLEWFHRIAIVAGAVWAGAWLVSTGLHRLALRLLLAVTVVFAAFALVKGASSGFALPAQPLGYQKNFVGSIVATVLLLLVAAPREFRLPGRVLVVTGVVLLGGLIATHSRGAMVAAAVGTLIWFFRDSGSATRGLRVAAIAAAIGIGIYAGISVHAELNQKTYNSLTQRARIEHATHRLWIAHPLTGVGLRFFKTVKFAGYSPPNNVFDEILAEAGVIGLLGFVVFVVGALHGLGRLPGDLATAGLCVVAARFVHGLFDIYWTGGTTTIAWVVAGMGLAAAALTDRARPQAVT